MLHWINTLLHKYYSKRWKFKSVRVLNQNKYDLFKQRGEGLYYINFKGDHANIISRIISFFSGGLSHSFIVLYTEDITNYFTLDELQLLKMKYIRYYGTDANFYSTRIWVLGSADNNGINYFNYSTYQDRKQSIRKVPIDRNFQKIVCKWLIQQKIMNAFYDFMGLVFFSLHVNSKKDIFCSELVYKAFDAIKVKVAKKENPSPKQIEDYNKSWIVYSDIK